MYKTILLSIIIISNLVRIYAQDIFIPPLSTRQVHLDFHTSGNIPDIGKGFDKKEWQETLKLGKVTQINLFAKGHQSWSYYPTEIGQMHPNLDFDLLGAQMEACHEINVKCPFYFAVGWSAGDAEAHPEWVVRNKNGSFRTTQWNFEASPTEKKPFYSWKTLCPAVSGPYHQYIMKQVEEICKAYPVDGFWFDIYHLTEQCYCQFCMERMKIEMVDINDEVAVSVNMNRAFKKHMAALRELVTTYHPNATVFFNATPHIRNSAIFKEKLYEMNTQQELEDLPTAMGGYDKLPLESKYHLLQGSPVVAMSGKFHKSWGEFGGFKYPEAMKYEAASMISFGVACNFGDQLHPNGRLNQDTYRNIGVAYEYVEKIEPYGIGGMPISRLGVWLTLNKDADHGVIKMLLEMHYDFIIANTENLKELEMVIIPSQQCLDSLEALHISKWIRKGGKLLVFSDGAFNESKSDFTIDFGARFIKVSEFDFDYTLVNNDLAENIVGSPFLNYKSGLWVKPVKGDVMATIVNPYFNRTYQQYSGHRETPYNLNNSSYPAVVRYNNVVFFAHSLDKLYYQDGARIHRELVKNAIDLLYENPMLQVKALSSLGRVSFLKQANEKRYVAHLLYAPPIQRGNVIVIEDFPPVQYVKLEVRVDERITKVYQIPGGGELPFVHMKNSIEVIVPAFTMHTGIVFEYE